MMMEVVLVLMVVMVKMVMMAAADHSQEISLSCSLG